MVPAMENAGEIGTGNHDAVVVDALWSTHDDATSLTLSLTMLGGAVKGEVVEVTFPGGTHALTRALTVLGVAPSDVHDHDIVTAAVLGMPCTLVVVRDPDGALGFALAP